MMKATLPCSSRSRVLVMTLTSVCVRFCMFISVVENFLSNFTSNKTELHLWNTFFIDGSCLNFVKCMKICTSCTYSKLLFGLIMLRSSQVCIYKLGSSYNADVPFLPKKKKVLSKKKGFNPCVCLRSYLEVLRGQTCPCRKKGHKNVIC